MVMVMEIIQHFSHVHPLTLADPKSDDLDHVPKCQGCSEKVFDPTYECSQCSFFLCKSCAELPREILRHPFHPLHKLTFRANPSPFHFSYCKVCKRRDEGFIYHCGRCGFGMHIGCASLKPSTKYEGHSHLLTVLDSVPDHCRCAACGEFGDALARCVICDVNFHVRCDDPVQLWPSIVSRHHSHPLSFATSPVKTRYDLCCDVCKKRVKPERPVYCCVECSYIAHIGCVVSEIRLNQKKNLKHFSHEHSLFIYEDKNDGGSCNGCKKSIQGPAYGCKLCNFFLDELCLELPRETRHPFHPLHSLALEFHDNGFRCGGCKRDRNGLAFGCPECPFNLDLECVLLEPFIKLEDHGEHLVNVFERIKGYPETSYLRCVQCDINFNILDCPLPITVKHECHIDRLTLKPHHYEDYDEFYCDVCEEIRDREECVYYCAECQFVSHVRCVISEVLPALINGKLGDVKLVKAAEVEQEGAEMEQEEAKKDRENDKGTRAEKDESRHPLTSFRDIMTSLTEDEKLKLHHYFDEVKTKFKEIFSVSYIYEASPYPDEEFQRFIEKINFGNELVLMKLFAYPIKETDLVNVGEHMITHHLAPVLQALLAKYGDISAEFILSPRLKLFFLVALCRVVYSMCNTKVKDVTEALLIDWLNMLKLVYLAGFKIQFALDNLKRVVRAYFCLRSERYEDKILNKLHTSIMDLSEEVKDRRTALEALTTRVQVLETEEKRRIVAKSKESSLMEKRLMEALEIGWMPAGANLL